MTTCFHPPFRSICHQLHIQRTSGEVVPVRARLTVEACAEALRCRRPVQDPDVLRQDPVQHLHVGKLGDGGFTSRASLNVFGELDPESATKLRGTQIYGDDLERAEVDSNAQKNGNGASVETKVRMSGKSPEKKH